MMSRLSYTVLGSSFAAGPGIDPILDVHAQRSGRNYANRLARMLDAELTDLTVAGATTATILDQPQVTLLGAHFPPQVPGVPATADLVTVTAGGNDLRYLGSMMFAAWRRIAPHGPVTQMMAPDFPAGLAVPTSEDVDRTAAGLAEIVARVRARAPRARILLVDYLTVIGAGTAPGPDSPFEPAEIATFRAVQAALEAAYVMAADRSGAELVAVSGLSRDHALGSAEPWVFPFIRDFARLGASFHPNAAGMEAVAAEIAGLIGRATPEAHGRWAGDRRPG
ncbi:GDSL-type esterase/lipase family protein [Actinoplanes teichomyceticus]|nr:GDSL-type esterase/lipase family protein [Actinoplanes teichomyceticus]GIF13392.1 hydrolase [Actinoplanes teichomyceticus]